MTGVQTCALPISLLRPLGEFRLFVVKNRVLVLVTLLPFVALVSNYHPPGITGTAPIVPVDEEVPVVVDEEVPVVVGKVGMEK